MIRKSLTFGTIDVSLEVITILIAKVLNVVYVTSSSDVYDIEFSVNEGRYSYSRKSYSVNDGVVVGL